MTHTTIVLTGEDMEALADGESVTRDTSPGGIERITIEPPDA